MINYVEIKHNGTVNVIWWIEGETSFLLKRRIYGSNN